MAVQIQFRRGLSTEWATANSLLAVAEMGIETDTSLFKIGNGVNNWSDLPYGGLRGYLGSAGYVGANGYTGSSGFTGSSGAYAAVGFTGSAGSVDDMITYAIVFGP